MLIHTRGLNHLGNYIIWGTFERTGLSAKMHAEQIIWRPIYFTIIEKAEQGYDYHHFANDLC